MVNKQTNLVLRSSLMIHMKAFESRHHLAELKAMLREELKVWSPVCAWRGTGFLLETVEAFLIILPEILLQVKPVQHLELTQQLWSKEIKSTL